MAFKEVILIVVYISKEWKMTLRFICCYMLIKCQQINILNQQLREVFEIKDLGVAKKIIRVEIIRDRNEGILYLTQQKYIKKVLEKFEM